MKRLRVLVAASCVAAAALTACAPTTETVSGIGGDGADSAVQPSVGPVQPTPSSWAVDDTTPGTPVDAPAEPVEVPNGALPLSVPLSATDVENISTPAAGSFSATETRDAFIFATAFTAARYSQSGLWLAQGHSTEGTAVAYYPFLPFMTADRQEAVNKMLLNQADNQVDLDVLAPPPPNIEGAQWLLPAVGNWQFGKPNITADGKTLNIVFEGVASAIYLAPDGLYMSVDVTEKVGYSLVPAKQGGWLVSDYRSSVVMGEPTVLAQAPVGRELPDYGDDVTPVPIDEAKEAAKSLEKRS